MHQNSNREIWLTALMTALSNDQDIILDSKHGKPNKQLVIPTFHPFILSISTQCLTSIFENENISILLWPLLCVIIALSNQMKVVVQKQFSAIYNDLSRRICKITTLRYSISASMLIFSRKNIFGLFPFYSYFRSFPVD